MGKGNKKECKNKTCCINTKKRKILYKKSLKPSLRVLYDKYIITYNPAKDNSRVDQTQKLNAYISKQPLKLIDK